MNAMRSGSVAVVPGASAVGFTTMVGRKSKQKNNEQHKKRDKHKKYRTDLHDDDRYAEERPRLDHRRVVGFQLARRERARFELVRIESKQRIDEQTKE